MDIQTIKKFSTTGKARCFVKELLGDGEIHTRKELVKYAKEKFAEFNFNIDSENAINCAVDAVVRGDQYEKVNPAMYRLKSSDVTQSDVNKVLELSQSYTISLRNIAKKINYVTATDEKIALLNSLKKIINFVDDCYTEIENEYCIEECADSNDEIQSMGMTL